MPSFLAGSRVPAGALNALTDLAVDIAGGPTSGTTPLIAGTLVVPAAPIDRVVTPSVQSLVAITDTGGLYSIEIRRNNAAGARYGYGRAERVSASNVSCPVQGDPFGLPAGQTATLVVVLTRITGSGTGEVVAFSGGSHLVASLKAAP